MGGIEAAPDLPFLAAVAAVMVVAALAHGTVGFGFPVISTPVVALMTDLRTAIIVTVLPNMAVNIASVLRGGNWRQSLGRHWPLTLYVFAGTIVGTRALILVPQEPLKLLLAAMILVYLQQARLKALDWSWLERHRSAGAALFGLVAGFLAGAVNVTVPPLVIYFMSLRLEAVAMTQILNLCFLVGKSTQAATLALAAKFSGAVLFASLPLTLLSLAALGVGMRIQSRIRGEAYRATLRAVLAAMAFLLIGQVAWHYAG